MSQQNQATPPPTNKPQPQTATPSATATPNPEANKPQPKTFTTIDGNTLMSQQYEPLAFAIETILPHGIFVFAGSPKVGKSWLTLDMCQAISTGGKLWEFNATQGDVLYLALEDKYNPKLYSVFNSQRHRGHRGNVLTPL